MNKVIINGLRLYAFHGVMPQERKTGAYYTIDLKLSTDFSHAIETDELDGTISYADIFQVVKQEMSIPSKLVEHLAGRIAKRLLGDYPQATSVWIRIIKENPPMGADCQGAGVELEMNK